LYGIAAMRASDIGSVLDSSFVGDTADALEEYLANAGFNVAGLWGGQAKLKLAQLLDEVKLGETSVGISKETGMPVRTVNVAKPLVFDFERGLVLVELFQTFDTDVDSGGATTGAFSIGSIAFLHSTRPCMFEPSTIM
jgi:hypothetical protein